MYKAEKFKASSPDSKAQGPVFAPYVQILEGSPLAHLIAEYELDKLDMEAFYPQERICNMQAQIAEKMGLFSGDLVSVGKESIASIGFPPEVTTMEDAFGMLHNIYQAIHQNIPEEEGWRYEQVDANTSKIFFNSPYEEFAAYGYVWGITHQFRPAGKSFSVYMETEDDMTVYRVVLKE